MRAFAAALVLLALLPAALGQEGHDHHGAASAGTQVVVDVRDDVQVGDLARFSVVIFGDNGLPEAHQDLRFQVMFDGRPLLETTAASGHDYDGIAQFDVTFPTPGPYIARVLDVDGNELGRLEGWAVPARTETASAVLEGPDVAEVGRLATYTFWPEDSNGTLVHHFYTLFEVRNGPTLVYRAKLHGHGGGEDGPAEVQIGFPAPGQYTVEATLFQGTPAGTQHLAYLPLRALRAVQVLPGLPSLVGLLPEETPGAMSVQAGDVVLSGFHDPSPLVGPSTLQHLSVLAQASDGQMRTHVDYAGRLVGPFGQTLFATKFMHESDGILEFATTQAVPGRYMFHVEHGEVAKLAIPYDVATTDIAPPLPYQVEIEGLDGAQVGVAHGVEVAIRNAAGEPFAHAEVDMQVVGPSGVPVATAKLHAHDDGRFPFTFTPLEPGPHRLRLIPYPLEARLVAFVDPASWSDQSFDVGAGSGWATVGKPLAPALEAQVPAPSRAPLAAALATLVLGGGLSLALFVRMRKR